MARPLEFGFEGRARDASSQLSRRLRRAGAVRAWAHLVAREGAVAAWAVLLGSYLAAILMLFPMDALAWLGLAAIHLVYGPLAWVFYQWSHELPTVNVGRVRRLHRWLERVAGMLPDDAGLDVGAKLGRPPCRGHSEACEAPWLVASVFLPHGTAVQVLAVEGRSCPAPGRRLAPGSTRWSFRVDRALAPLTGATLAALRAVSTPPGAVTLDVALDEGGALVWTVDQHEPEAELPVWPFARLQALLEPEIPSTTLPSPGSTLEAGGRPWSGPRLGFALRRRGLELVDLFDLERARVTAAVPHPSVMLASMMLVVNGLLGGVLLAIEAMMHGPGLAPLASAGGVGPVVWAFSCVGGVLIGTMALAPVTTRLWRAYRGAPAADVTEVGSIAVDDACIHLHAPVRTSATHTIDLTRPFSVELSRDRSASALRVRVHLTLRQQRPGPLGLSVIGVTSELDASDRVMALPAWGADYPEMEPDDFHRLWTTVRQASVAHGETPPALACAGSVAEVVAGRRLR